MRDLQRTMSTWGQYYNAVYSCIQRIGNERIQAPGLLYFLTWHHPTTLEASTCLTKNSCSSKNCTQFDSLPSDLLCNICMWNLGVVHSKKLKPVLARLTQHNPILCASTSYKLKYILHEYYIHYDVILHAWADILQYTTLPQEAYSSFFSLILIFGK